MLHLPTVDCARARQWRDNSYCGHGQKLPRPLLQMWSKRIFWECIYFLFINCFINLLVFFLQDCGVSLSSNAENVGGCFPLDDHILCKGCNINRIRNLVTNHDLQSDMYANQKLLRNMLNSSSSPNNQQQQSSNYNARSTDL